MSISGLVVHIHPQSPDGIVDRITDLDGVEIHAVTDRGQLVVTVDLEDDGEAADILNKLMNMEGVVNTSLVFNYFERDPGEEETVP